MRITLLLSHLKHPTPHFLQIHEKNMKHESLIQKQLSPDYILSLFIIHELGEKLNRRSRQNIRVIDVCIYRVAAACAKVNEVKNVHFFVNLSAYINRNTFITKFSCLKEIF